MPDRVDLAWAAGFMDGEGYFYMKKNTNRKAYLRVACRQVRREPLEKLKRILGGRIYGPYKQGGIGSQPISAWEISGNAEAYIAAELLRPYLSPHKIEQLDFVLERINYEKHTVKID